MAAQSKLLILVVGGRSVSAAATAYRRYYAVAGASKGFLISLGIIAARAVAEGMPKVALRMKSARGWPGQCNKVADST